MTKKTKPDPRLADHKLYGPGQILCVRELDSGGGVYVAEVKFEDATRLIRLLAQYWHSDIVSLIAKPKKKAPAKSSLVKEEDLTAQVGAA